jgi:hypothetical protein
MVGGDGVKVVRAYGCSDMVDMGRIGGKSLRAE